MKEKKNQNLALNYKNYEEIKTIKESGMKLLENPEKVSKINIKIVECKEKFAKLRIYSNEFQVRNLTEKIEVLELLDYIAKFEETSNTKVDDIIFRAMELGRSSAERQSRQVPSKKENKNYFNNGNKMIYGS